MKYIFCCIVCVFSTTRGKTCLYNRLFVLLVNFLGSLLCCQHVLPEAVACGVMKMFCSDCFYIYIFLHFKLYL